MWSGYLLRRSSSCPLGSIGSKAAQNVQFTYREASISSVIPFGWFSKKEDTPTQVQTAVIGESGVASAKNRGETFKKHEEKFIPVTRRTLVNKLVVEDGLLNWEEKRLLETFAASLDTYYSQKFYALLEEAKVREQMCVCEREREIV